MGRLKQLTWLRDWTTRKLRNRMSLFTRTVRHTLSSSNNGLLRSVQNARNKAIEIYAPSTRFYSVESELGLVKHKTEPSNTIKGPGLTDHKINTFERFILVWSGKYKSVEEVPPLVSQATLELARNKARITINLGMGAATLLACLAMVWLGKKDAAEGKNVTDMNLEWHRQINEAAGKK